MIHYLLKAVSIMWCISSKKKLLISCTLIGCHFLLICCTLIGCCCWLAVRWLVVVVDLLYVDWLLLLICCTLIGCCCCCMQTSVAVYSCSVSQRWWPWCTKGDSWFSATPTAANHNNVCQAFVFTYLHVRTLRTASVLNVSWGACLTHRERCLATLNSPSYLKSRQVAHNWSRFDPSTQHSVLLVLSYCNVCLCMSVCVCVVDRLLAMWSATLLITVPSCLFSCGLQYHYFFNCYTTHLQRSGQTPPVRVHFMFTW